MNLINIADCSVEKFNMIKCCDKKIIVGLSGGADSIALLHYLKFSRNMDTIACHINHKLRGDESTRDMNFVRQICNDWDIPCFINEIDVASYSKENRIGLEEAGRLLRYNEFNRIANLNDTLLIATAHTLSDSAETLLLNLTRGAGLNGLKGIPPIRDNIIRPFIECTREQVENYCLINNIKYVNDSSNFSDDYSRNKIRNNIIPILKEINPEFEKSVARSITLINRDCDFIDKEAQDCLAFCDEISYGCYNIKGLEVKDVAIRSRIISDILDRNCIKKTFKLINSIDDIILKGYGKVNITVDRYIQIKDKKLIIISSQDNVDYFEDLLPKLRECTISNPYKYTTTWGDLLCIYTTNKQNIVENGKINKNQLYICLDYDKIEGSVFIRGRKTGDKIEFSHRKGTKSLKKLFIDEKLTNPQKSKVIVLSDDNGVIAVGGFGVSKNVAVDNYTNTFLVIKI